MKAEKALPEPDRAPGAAHPRETFNLVGHDDAEAALAGALDGARMHHAWLLSGPKGVGKATLAYRFARAALGARRIGPRPLDVDPADPIARRVMAGAHGDLFVLRRGVNEKTGKARRDISADDARAMGGFFALAPAEGGMRVAIIDAVDDLNRHAANAILKTLEEPPPRSALILVCHAPGAALATIRSRCRRLALRVIDDGAMRAVVGAEADAALLRLARGRPGRAIALAAQGAGGNAAAIEHDLDAIVAGDAARALPALHGKLSGEAMEKLSAAIDLAGERVRAEAAESGASGWADAWSALEQVRVEAEDLDMDPRHALARAVAVLDRAASARR